MNRAFACLLILGLFSIELSWGQGANTGAIVGSVTDQTGAVLAKSKIVATNTATGIAFTTTTDDQGNFRIEALPPGEYNVRTEHQGFMTTNFNTVTLYVNQALRLDPQLKMGAVDEIISVSANPVAVDTENSTISDVVTGDLIANLPLNGREFIGLSTLVPGAQNQTNTKSGSFQARYKSKGYVISFDGGRAGYNSYNVDGMESVDPDTNQLISSPPLDAIQEFRVSTSMYSAEHGRSGGAEMDIVTKGGTNQFHGEAYEYHRDKSLDALPVLFTGTRQDRPNYINNQFGAAIGGPILKNKAFFFFSPEWLRSIQPGALTTGFVPTDLERQGDLSQSLNPYTGQPVQLNDPYTQQPIPGNVVPANLITSVGQKLMALLPEPNHNAPGGSNYQVFRAGTTNTFKAQARIDYNFNDANHLMGSFNLGNSQVLHEGTPLAIADYASLENDRAVTIGYTHTFSSNLLNEFHYGQTWWYDGDTFASYNNNQNYAKTWGIWTGSLKTTGTPSVVLFGNGTADYLGNYGIPDTHNDYNTHFIDTLTWQLGKHSLKFGGDFMRQGFDWLYDLSALGVYYVGLNDGIPGGWNVSGSGFSDLLMGLSPYQLYSGQAATPQRYRRNVIGAFIQDDWKVAPRLTLNLGLRYDYLTPFSEIDNEFVTFDQKTAEVVFAKGAPANLAALAQYPHETGGPNRPYEPNKTNFAPRVGIAWRPFNNNRTVIRSGYGIFYAAETAQYTTYGSWVQPFGGYFSYGALPALSFDGQNRLQTIDLPPIQRDLFLGQTPGLAYLTAPNVPTTNIQQYNLSVERELRSGLVAEVAYVGNKGTHLSSILSSQAFDPSLVNRINSVYGASWAGPTFFVQGSNSKYNSLQAKLKGNLGKSLNFLISYSYGQALAQASQEEFNQNVIVDRLAAQAYDVKVRYGLADFDIHHRLAISGGYALPFGRNLRFGSNWSGPLNAVLGGWSAHWIGTFQGGFPYSVLDTSGNFPDRICNGNLPSGKKTVDHWFDYSCFPTHQPTFIPDPNNPGQMIATNVQGDAGVNIIRASGLSSLDFGIFKGFSLTEKVGLQFRCEAFNSLNHPNLTYPSPYNNFQNTASGAQIIGQNDNRDVQLALKLLF